jgi:hypothetical protein
MKNEWEIGCTSETFQNIRHSDQFKKVLALSRLLNSILATQTPVLGLEGSADTPETLRQRLYSFLYLGALLYEGLVFSESLRSTFHHAEVFESGLGRLLRDPEVSALRKTYLKPIRNKMIFHFDHDVIHEGLETLNDPSYVFVKGEGSSFKAVYFQLADQATLHYLLGKPKSETEFATEFQKLIESVTKLSKAFTDASQELITDVVERLGFTYRSKE